jgi:hypothetical protein
LPAVVCRPPSPSPAPGSGAALAVEERCREEAGGADLRWVVVMASDENFVGMTINDELRELG